MSEKENNELKCPLSKEQQKKAKKVANVINKHKEVISAGATVVSAGAQLIL